MKIKNLLFQPITLHLAGGESLHLLPRETREVAARQVSGEIRLAEERGLVYLTGAAHAQPDTHIDKTTQKKGDRK